MMLRPFFKELVRRVRSDKSGISMVEFALVLPVLLTLGLYGTEIARLATTRMKVSQIALTLADNAARLGQTDNSGVTPTISEADVDAVLSGALRQGETIDLESNGRIILSSLEFEDNADLQYIHWQRCIGALDAESAYGDEGDNNGLGDEELDGMGTGTTRLTAQSGSAIMYVEIEYRYDPLFQNPFGSGELTLREEAGFQIRDDRNLRQPDQKGLSGVEQNEC